MNHSVREIQTLHDDAARLLDSVVYALVDDVILAKINSSVQNLKNNWKGADAGVQISSLISVYNNMVAIRNALAEYAVATSKVASDYREIQRSNGSITYDALSVLTYETKTKLEDYTDTSDTINIVPEAANGATDIEAASNAMSGLQTAVFNVLGSITGNWTAGPGQSDAADIQATLNNNLTSYQTTLSQVAANIKTALSNYGI